MILNEWIARALEERPIVRCDLPQMQKKLTELLSQLYILTGYTLPQPYDLMVVVGKLANNLKRDYPHLTMGEVAICFELGAEGRYGELRGLSLTAYSSWLKQYNTSELRYQAVLKRHRDKQQSAAVLPAFTDSYNSECETRQVQRAYAAYCNGYPLDRLMPGRLYRILQRRRLLAHSPDEKWAAMKQFAGWKPDTTLPLNNEMLQHYRRDRAMQHLLGHYFDAQQAAGVQSLPL